MQEGDAKHRIYVAVESGKVRELLSLIHDKNDMKWAMRCAFQHRYTYIGSVLIAIGGWDHNLFEMAVEGNHFSSARLWIRCGARLENVKAMPTREMINVQCAVLACRKIVICIMAMKRRYVRSMRQLDRFLIRQLCLEMWTMRSKSKWSIPLHRRTKRKFVE